MKIAVDLRSLQSGSVSGVENYSLNLIEHLLALDKKNSYKLFYNSWGNGTKLPEFHFVNSETIKLSWPNKLLNLGLKYGTVRLSNLIGDFDLLFLPNLNQFNLEPGKKLALTVHDLSPVVTPEYYDAKRKLWHKFLNFRKAYERANVLLAVSEWTKADLLSLFKLPEGKIKVIHPGIDHNRFNSSLTNISLREIRNKYELPGDFILFLNTIEPRKNLTNLIRAFENLDWAGSLVIAGRRGWKYKKILRQIRQSAKWDKIHFLGYIKEDEKAALIKLARILAYPSFYEGFGFQPLEAAACGTPVVASHTASIPEVAGNFALLVNPYDIASIKNGLDSALKNGVLRQGMVNKGLEYAKNFTWQKTAGQILKELEALQ